jgi:hypothetical protein
MDDWTGREPCRKDHADLWYGGSDGERKAKTLCRTQCPLASFERCARDALKDPDNQGVWAGMYLPSLVNWKRREEREQVIARLEQMVAQQRKAS